jgi:hypothetical protein
MVWSTIGDTTTRRWFLTTLVPAITFWSGGVIVLISQGLWHGWETWFAAQTSISQLMILTAIGSVVFLSIALVGVFQPLITALLAGQWPRLLSPLSDYLIARTVSRQGHLDSDLQILCRDRNPSDLDYQRRLVGIAEQLRWIPRDSLSVGPTRFGNIMASATERPLSKYGLSVGICWPRLWLVLPKEARSDLSDARAEIDTSVRLMSWSLLFTCWSAYSWWFGLVGGGAALVIYHFWTLRAVGVFGDLIESAFDMYRVSLYRTLRWPLPSSPAQETLYGNAVTRYLEAGVAVPGLQYDG